MNTAENRFKTKDTNLKINDTTIKLSDAKALQKERMKEEAKRLRPKTKDRLAFYGSSQTKKAYRLGKGAVVGVGGATYKAMSSSDNATDGIQTASQTVDTSYGSARTLRKGAKEIASPVEEKVAKSITTPIKTKTVGSPWKTRRKMYSTSYKAQRGAYLRFRVNNTASVKAIKKAITKLKMAKFVQKASENKIVKASAKAVKIGVKAVATLVKGIVSAVGLTLGTFLPALILVVAVVSLLPSFNYTTYTVTGGCEVEINEGVAEIGIYIVDDWTGDWSPFATVQVPIEDGIFTYTEGEDGSVGNLEGAVLDNEFRITGEIRGSYVNFKGTYKPEKKMYLNGTIVISTQIGIIDKGRLNYPLASKGVVTTYFGAIDDLHSYAHTGVDFAVPQGTAILSAESGEVTDAGWEADGLVNGGYSVVIKHDNGNYTAYCHIREGGIMVEVGQRVVRGQIIAEVGSTGRSSGPHLHFMVWDANGTLQDGLRFLEDY